MSKVFKSDYIHIGTPKPLETVMRRPAPRPVPGTAPEEAGKEKAKGPEELANSIIEDAKQMYLKIIEEANQEAEKIAGQANADAEKLLLSAREEGYREGHKAGHRDSRKEAQRIIDQAAEIRAFLDHRKELLYKEIEQEVVDLVLEVSKKVIGKALSEDPEQIFSLIKQALDKCAFRNKLILRVSQADYPYICDNKDKISRMVEGISGIEVVADLSLKDGGCVIETPSGEIHSGIETQLAELEKIFLYVLRNE